MAHKPATQLTLWLLLALAAAASSPRASAASTASLQGSLGSAVSISSDVLTTVTFGSGERLLVQSTASTDMVLSKLTSAAGLPAAPAGFQFLAGAVAYKLQVASAAASLVTARLTSASLAGVTGSTVLHVLQADADQDAFGELAGAAYNASTSRVTVSLPHGGTYALATTSGPALSVPTLFGQARAIGGSFTNISLPQQVSLLVRTANAGSSGNALTTTLSTFSETPVSRSLGQYLATSLVQQEALEATLVLPFSSAVSADAAQAVRLSKYSAAAGNWTMVSSGYSVDAAAHTFTQSMSSAGLWSLIDSMGSGLLTVPGATLDDVYRAHCYKVDMPTTGVLRAIMTKKSASGMLRLYANQGTICPSPSQYQHRTQAATLLDQERSLEIAAPFVRKGMWSFSVYRDDNTGVVPYSLTILVPNNPANAGSATQASMLALATASLVAVVAAAMAF